MADNVTLPSTGTPIEAEQQADGSERERFTLVDALGWLRAIAAAIAKPYWLSMTAAALRVVSCTSSLGAGDVLGNATTCVSIATVTNLTNIGSVSAAGLVMDASAAVYFGGPRARIS